MSHFGNVRLMGFFLSLAVTITDEPAQILINRASGCVSVAGCERLAQIKDLLLNINNYQH